MGDDSLKNESILFWSFDGRAKLSSLSGSILRSLGWYEGTRSSMGWWDIGHISPTAIPCATTTDRSLKEDKRVASRKLSPLTSPHTAPSPHPTRPRG